MKKLSFFGKILFWCNSIVAVLLLVSFILPYLPPKQFSSLSLLSLGVSPLIILTFLFGVYWLVKLKKQFILSAVMLVAAYLFFNPFYKFPSNEQRASGENTISVLSYNVLPLWEKMLFMEVTVMKMLLLKEPFISQLERCFSFKHTVLKKPFIFMINGFFLILKLLNLSKYYFVN